jgi:hypothetical protein
VKTIARLLLVVSALFLQGCDSQLTTPADSEAGLLLRSETPPTPVAPGTVLGWNEIARELVSTYSTSPPRASRVYALLSVAEYNAIMDLGSRASEAALARVAAVEASWKVLRYLYPGEGERLGTLAFEQQNYEIESEAASYDDVIYAMSVGKHAANEVIEQAWTDGSDEPWTGTIPTGPGIWYSSADPPQPPVDSNWPAVRPWLMSSASQFRAPPPPAFGSAEFLAALAEVKHYSDHRTPEQAAIAVHWADGAGTPTPPGHWNQIAAEYIRRDALDELNAARVLMYMNMAIMDAGISCWDSKFHYWLLRPSQADPAITLAVALPNFPAYTSGHSTFSAAGAAVLSYFFPQDETELLALADEAGISRIYGGIHYHFDKTEGAQQGFAIAELAIARAQAEAPGGF